MHDSTSNVMKVFIFGADIRIRTETKRLETSYAAVKHHTRLVYLVHPDGFEPTSQHFQCHANPTQLQVHIMWGG